VFQSKKNTVFILLAGLFITNAVVAELIGGKLIQLGDFTLSMGIILWPFIFITTDLINEYFGRTGVRKLTYLTVLLIGYSFLVLLAGVKIPASPLSPVSDQEFSSVFGQSMWIIVGSLVAFVVSQLLDVFIFWKFKKLTGEKHIWLRATGSTVISQLIDTFIVAGIAFYLPGKITLGQYFDISITGYGFKLLLAVALTPFIYLGHYLIKRYLKEDEVRDL
jgi:queuosine precursor transporter